MNRNETPKRKAVSTLVMAGGIGAIVYMVSSLLLAFITGYMETPREKKMKEAEHYLEQKYHTDFDVSTGGGYEHSLPNDPFEAYAVNGSVHFYVFYENGKWHDGYEQAQKEGANR